MALVMAGYISLHSEAGETAIKAAAPEHVGPWNTSSLFKTPEFEWMNEGEIRGIFYKGEPYKGEPSRVFAWYASPGTLAGDTTLDKSLPAMVLVHGGGGRAFPHWAKLWASRGYAAIAMDLAGCGPDGKPMTNGGPGQGHDMKFGTIDLPVTEQWSFHAVANVVKAHSLIRSFDAVDPNRIGLTGISWGGYLTCIVAGVDNRFKAASPVYGCGFLHDNSTWLGEFAKMSQQQKNKWVRLWDPSAYVPKISMPVLFVNGGKDFAYPPDSYAKTYDAVPNSVYRNMHFVPDLPHGHIFDKPKCIEVFFDHQLNGASDLLPQIGDIQVGADSLTAPVKDISSVKSSQLHYTLNPLTDNPRERKWHSVKSRVNKGSGVIVSPLPEAGATCWFLTVETHDGVSVASRIHLK